MRAKKSLGQNFLKSKRALSKIIEVGDIKPNDTVLEIGPGLGALTEKLLACLPAGQANSLQLIAVEKDDGLFEMLKEKFQKEINSGKLILIHDDILNFEATSYKLQTNSYKLIANIPYNLTGAIFKKFLETDSQPEKIALLVQKEVAERIVAKDGKESILSISIKAYGVPLYIETVKAGSFAPAPKVDSAIIEISAISKEFFANFSEETFFKTLKAGFQSKRKKLSSNLSNLYPKERVLSAFKELGLDENTRAEDIDANKWGEIVEILK